MDAANFKYSALNKIIRAYSKAVNKNTLKLKIYLSFLWIEAFQLIFEGDFDCLILHQIEICI